MKRHNLEVILAWLDALRRRDLQALRSALDPAIVWQGLRDDLSCHGPHEVVAGLTGSCSRARTRSRACQAPTGLALDAHFRAVATGTRFAHRRSRVPVASADAFGRPARFGREATEDARYKNQRLAGDGAPADARGTP
jgi:hypothetical protein